MTKIAEKIWFSQVLLDPTLMKGFTCELNETDIPTASELIEKMQTGVPVSAEDCPDMIFWKFPGKKPKAQPDIFQGGVGLIISRAVADVMRDFDLGRTGIFPLSVRQHDRLTPVPGEYYWLAIGEQKHALVGEESENVDLSWTRTDLWAVEADLKNDDIAVRDTALQGVDLWADPALSSSIFLSDRLARALKEARLTRRFGLRTCRLVRHSPVIT